MDHLPSWVRLAGWSLAVAFAALPLLSGVAIWRAVAERRAGNEPLARSWADATRSFVGMTVSSWLLLAGGGWAYAFALRWLAEAKGH
jgi:hypothetical protein